MKIPYKELSEDALNGVLDDYVLREGTDYGDFAEGGAAQSLAAKRQALMNLLASGEAQLWFDPQTETTTLRLPDEQSGL